MGAMAFLTPLLYLFNIIVQQSSPSRYLLRGNIIKFLGVLNM